jgi:hypothetical protein
MSLPPPLSIFYGEQRHCFDVVELWCAAAAAVSAVPWRRISDESTSVHVGSVPL